MSSWAKEPLLHFLLLGSALFAIDSALPGREASARDADIVVSAGRVESLVALFAKTWQRPPSEEELRFLIQEHVLEEALYREGLAFGLDKDDTVVRRRVRQKMEFVVDEVMELREPTTDDLVAWLAEHADAYAEPMALSFRQVFLSPRRRGDALLGDAERLLASLAVDPLADASELGDGTLLEHANPDLRLDDMARMYGEAFAADLQSAPLGQWIGPIESVYGFHLVIVDHRRAGRSPELDEVRAEVERDWSFAEHEHAKKRFHERVLDEYSVKIEWPSGLAPLQLEGEFD